ncbi:bolA-like protein DDB_G0274169 [Littorina saxatilis]|uniref:BolA-like protein 1 n=1 Tax=Littorina saxatilis TaxID=31220 RepID=A0AAN9GK85_9CAEN
MAKAVSSISAKLLRSAFTANRFTTAYAQSSTSQSSSAGMADIVKPMETSMKKKLAEAFKPSVLQIVNESYMHNVPKGSETHFKVVIVSDAFEGVQLVQRHRKVNNVLEEEFGSGLHALSIVAKTPIQWEKSTQEVGQSPPCRGGAGL